jgi:hypothetical protein
LRKGTSRLTSQAKLEMAARRARVATLAFEGKSVRDCEQILRSEGFKHCDHVTVVKDLKLERDRLAAATRATTVLHRQKVLEELTQLREFVRARGWDDPNYVADLLSIVDRVIRLMGLAEQHHHVSVVTATNDDIPAEKLIGWRRWIRETRDVPESSFDAIWAVCRKLAQPATAETTALIGPPADSPLWHDNDDEKEPN